MVATTAAGSAASIAGVGGVSIGSGGRGGGMLGLQIAAACCAAGGAEEIETEMRGVVGRWREREKEMAVFEERQSRCRLAAASRKLRLRSDHGAHARRIVGVVAARAVRASGP